MSKLFLSFSFDPINCMLRHIQRFVGLDFLLIPVKLYGDSIINTSIFFDDIEP